ncbi:MULTISPECIES: DNA adenine methylase [unclassified Sphingobium]|uniref:DNA adenine methylase n=1 Tax=unclassified Sphingobium TaxID=2611147 RepID=UPI0022242A61|nr:MULTISPECIES: DNA adenine methylase [unclassified Sphingobium]MCW2395199.1 DNA adenine methylase [Sphingobium sp. B8D3B]MCW2418713.1 DNA adenine methylase [Sphingobium sp. B8D3C]
MKMEPVQPARPLAAWIGGKRKLAKRLIARINEIDHDSYVEPFVGMGGVFLRRDRRPPCEVINDWSEDVSTFFRVVQRHFVPFVDMIRFQISSRANFEKLAAQDPRTLTDLERSARFLYLQRLAFGGKVDGRNFGTSPGLGARFDVTKIVPMIEAVHERLAAVTIERLPWRQLIERWDRPATLFYLDPPYHGSEGDYGAGMFGRAEFAEMADVLGGIKGRFIMSINDHPEIRELFARFTIDEAATSYSVGGQAKAKAVRELIITG